MIEWTDRSQLPAFIDRAQLSISASCSGSAIGHFVAWKNTDAYVCDVCVFLESKVEGGKSLVLTNVVQKLHEPVASRCIERHARQAVNSSGTNGDAHQH